MKEIGSSFRCQAQLASLLKGKLSILPKTAILIQDGCFFPKRFHAQMIGSEISCLAEQVREIRARFLDERLMIALASLILLAPILARGLGACLALQIQDQVGGGLPDTL